MVSEDNKSALRLGAAKLKGPMKWVLMSVEVALVLLFAYVAAGLAHQVLAGSRPLPSIAVKASSAPEGSKTATAYLRFDPFFRAVASAETREVQDTVLPESNLQMEVFGLRAQRNGQGAAIVKLQNGEQKLVEVGQDMAPGVRLTGVYTDRLELNRGGRREAVYLVPEEQRSALLRTTVDNRKLAGTRTPSGPVISQNSQQASKSTAQKVIQEIKNLGLKPVRRNRRIIGFRLPEDLPQVAQLLGFEAADILLSVNGEPVNSFERFAELEEELANARQLIVEIERRGEVRRVPVSSLGS